MLAIAAIGFNKPSETFIRDHVRTIAPEETVLLSEISKGTKELSCPILLVRVRHPLRKFAGEMEAWLRRTTAKPAPWRPRALSEEDERRAGAFLEKHRVTTLLAEFGPVGHQYIKLCRNKEIRLFVHFHGYDASTLLLDEGAVNAYKELFASAAGIIVPSRFLADKLVGVGCPPNKLHVSPYGIDADQFAPAERRPAQLIAVGRLVEKKAPHLSIQAFAAVAPYFPNARLDIIGEGPLRSVCERTIRNHGLSGRVTLHGAKDHGFVVDLMRQSSVFVQHSVTASSGDAEGLAISLLEAMACEVPVVATRHNGLPEAVQDGVTGFLVDEHDVAGMAAAITDLLNNPDRAAAMGVAGRARVLEYFTHEKARDRLRAIIGLPVLSPSAAP